jgi:hypothetical protein
MASRGYKEPTGLPTARRQYTVLILIASSRTNLWFAFIVWFIGWHIKQDVLNILTPLSEQAKKEKESFLMIFTPLSKILN